VETTAPRFTYEPAINAIVRLESTWSAPSWASSFNYEDQPVLCIDAIRDFLYQEANRIVVIRLHHLWRVHHVDCGVKVTSLVVHQSERRPSVAQPGSCFDNNFPDWCTEPVRHWWHCAEVLHSHLS
jgi:hypothetical protein